MQENNNEIVKKKTSSKFILFFLFVLLLIGMLGVGAVVYRDTGLPSYKTRRLTKYDYSGTFKYGWEDYEITVTFNVYVKNCKFKCGNTTLKEQEFFAKGKKYTFRGKTGALLKKYSKNLECKVVGMCYKEEFENEFYIDIKEKKQ